ncbi:MAG: hypothetical protein ACYC9L_00860 [Sulfuricaulis sp.]
MSNIGRNIIGGISIVMAALFAASMAFAADVGGGAKPASIGPVINIAHGTKCVEPTEEMRHNHMKYILHQRNMTMHEGIRTTQFSLKNCVDCHADPKTNSVLGKNGFCQSCHAYAAVSIDCFSCHSSSPEQSGQAHKVSLTSPMHLLEKMRISAIAGNVVGSRP